MSDDAQYVPAETNYEPMPEAFAPEKPTHCPDESGLRDAARCEPGELPWQRRAASPMSPADVSAIPPSRDVRMRARAAVGLASKRTGLAATCGLTVTTTRNKLPHAMPKGECDQQENYNSKSVHCEIPHMRNPQCWRRLLGAAVPPRRPNFFNPVQQRKGPSDEVINSA
jgi:hypothetical protein